MNRLDFLKKLTLTVTATIVAPKVLLSESTAKTQPLKFTSGTNITPPQTMSYNGAVREPKLMVVHGKLGCGKTYGPHDFNKFKNS